MNEHRATSNGVQNVEPPQPRRLPPGSTRNPIAPGGRSLASRYGLPTLRTQRAQTSVQTVEQELMSYVTAPLSADGTDSLNFWAVSSCRD